VKKTPTDWESITFIVNTPEGPNYRRNSIVRTLSKEVGNLKGGSPSIHDPAHFAAPSWLTIERAIEIHNNIFYGAREKLNQGSPEFEDRKTAVKFLWKKLLPIAKPPTEEHFSPYYRPYESAPVLPAPTKKRKRTPVDLKLKVVRTKKLYTGKNANRLKYYRGQTIKSLLAAHKDLKVSDITYDLRQGYAKVKKQ
jgi:hypothetical protein